MQRALVSLLCAVALPAMAEPVASFLPADTDYDPDVPKPSEVLGYELGEWHVRHDQLVSYMRAVAQASDRVSIEVYGHTHEQRPLLLLTIASPERLANIDRVRKRHLRASDTPEQVAETPEGPVFVWQAYSVHGDESSGANASLAMAYYLAAARGERVQRLLDETVVLMDPAINPDGLSRFAQWANSHKGRHPVADDAHREHNQAWPGGRTNHYWFDLNRDWLLLQHPESRARISVFQDWRPHVLTDFHEMGHEATYFFQPGVPDRTNPLTPERNQALTRKIAEYHAEALDEAGQLYWSEEVFDDYYYGKGSTYPDVQGTVGILFEQASARGHLIETPRGERSFADSIRNQVITSFSTLRAARENADALKRFQRSFFARAANDAEDDDVDAYIIGDDGDPARAHHLIEILRRHDIRVHRLAETFERDDQRFEPGSAYVVPTEQRQYRLLKALMEERTDFPSTTFYDVSTWNLPHSFGLPYARARGVDVEDLEGEAVGEPAFPSRRLQPDDGAHAYAFDWDGYHAPRGLQRLLEAGANVRVATKPFTARTADGERQFERGAVIVSLGSQSIAKDTLIDTLETIAEEDGVRVSALTSGLTPEGVDLGSPSVSNLEPLEPLLVVGRGVNPYEAGEAWHLLDTRVGMGVPMIDTPRLSEIDFDDYTHVIMVDGRYDDVLDEETAKRLHAWVEDGGYLLATKQAARWVADNGVIGDDEAKHTGTKETGGGRERDDDNDDDEPERRRYADYSDHMSRLRISGALVSSTLDTTHPLGYGYDAERIALFRNSTLFLEPSENGYQTVGRYTDEPVISGYIGDERREELAGSASVLAQRVGDGAVVRLADNPNFRGIMYGTSKLFLNALFFAELIERRAIPD